MTESPVMFTDNFPRAGFPYSMGRVVLSHEDFPVHGHNCLELCLILGGQGFHHADGAEYPLVAGDVFVIKEQHIHGFKNTQRLEMVNIMFQRELLADTCAYLPSLPGYHMLFDLEPAFRQRHHFSSHLRLDGTALTLVERLLPQMEEEYHRQASGYESMLVGLFIQLAVLLSRHYAHITAAPSRALLQVDKAISVLESEYTQRITLEQLAEVTLCSVNSLLRLFKQATGMTPMDYLLRVRLRKASALLTSSDLSITSIANQVGFSDGNYFTRQFKQQTGWTPLAYRRNLRG
ncbi:MAG TPA: helix-turn-helix domain-containing protein [Armatimonadota bacterium]|jgi:AraC-like DNA-binding protein